MQEKPEMFQFIPNERQVKEANKLLKTLSHGDGNKKVEGVPVFSAQNLDIAIATKDGIKWYTPYFFDKSMLDNILDESVDQHFDALIQTRHLNRRKDVVVDDNLPAEIVEEMGESMWDPPEVQEVMDEMGNSGIPLSIISKAAEIQLLYTVDKVLLGNRWLRKATGIQPKFPYMIDSFEKNTSKVETVDNSLEKQGQTTDFQFPFGDWFSHPLLKKQQSLSDTRDKDSTVQQSKQEVQLSPFLPKITMVGISTGEPGKMSKATLRKTMDDLTKELEQVEQGNQSTSTSMFDERDPLFVANVGNYYPGVSKSGSARWVRGGSH
ncbi:hypothetical protein ACJIZ3_022252 [Penstemon smallii]|uniref:Uncharacterized protein n=1 Tax=Penstemon smallii TaxID=265156 RepID=A0ABD3TM15_9LAMI